MLKNPTAPVEERLAETARQIADGTADTEASP